RNIIDSIERLMDNDTGSIGIGSPGPLDYRTGIIGKTPNLPLQGVNLKSLIKSRFRKKVCIENDANCFVLAEAILGAGKKNSFVAGLTIGTGLGSGLVIDKKIYHGRCSAAEIGHTTINFNGPKSKCGNNGCLESYVSARGILSRTSLKVDDTKELFDMASKGNKKALAAWEKTGFYLGIGITNIINTLDPEIIVIGGKIAGAWPYFNRKLKETVKERALFKCKIVKSSLKDGGILGAALLRDC
ncbi:ROK family protein, partial [Candidatus Woesearchaeota archaeon]|nr:ROK family protein [Candidatus Woesearchaeota archaeon]